MTLHRLYTYLAARLNEARASGARRRYLTFRERAEKYFTRLDRGRK